MKYKRPKPIFGKQKEVKFSHLDGSEPITESWNEFKKAIPISLSPELFTVMKQAYFSGAMSLFGALMLGLDDSTPDETPGDLQKMERIQREFDYFRTNQQDFLKRAFMEWETRTQAQ